jgi:hypothetical protein
MTSSREINKHFSSIHGRATCRSKSWNQTEYAKIEAASYFCYFEMKNSFTVLSPFDEFKCALSQKMNQSPRKRQIGHKCLYEMKGEVMWHLYVEDGGPIPFSF